MTRALPRLQPLERQDVVFAFRPVAWPRRVELELAFLYLCLISRCSPGPAEHRPPHRDGFCGDSARLNVRLLQRGPAGQGFTTGADIFIYART